MEVGTHVRHKSDVSTFSHIGLIISEANDKFEVSYTSELSFWFYRHELEVVFEDCRITHDNVKLILSIVKKHE